MKLTSVTKEEWTPDWRDNLSLPKSEQVRIHLNFPTIEEKEGVSQIEYIRGKDGEVESFKIVYQTKKLLQNHVSQIDNLIDVRDGKEVQVKTGHDLLNSKNKQMQPLVQQIIAQLTTADDLEDDEKN